MSALQKAKIAEEIANMVELLTTTERQKFAMDLQKLNVSSLRWLKEELEEREMVGSVK